MAMTLKSILLASGIALTAINVNAQQSPAYSQYMFNMLAVNPAYAGSRDVLSMTALYRQQWSGIDGAPKTFSFSADMPVAREKVGLGINLYNDRIGVSNTTGFGTNYAFRIRTGKGTLALGLSASITQYRADYTSLSTSPNGQSDPSFNQNINTVKPNFGAGLYYSTDFFYAGIAVPTLVSYNISGLDSVVSYQKRSFFGMAGVVFKLSDEIRLKPSTMVKYMSGAPMQIDLNANLWLRDIIGLGASYRTGDAILGMIEVQATPNFRLGYAYDYPLTRLRTYSSGSHEIMLRYEFATKRNKIVSPRYF